MEWKYSSLMIDNSNSDHGKEAILDYEISWVLRTAADKEAKENKPRLHSQCMHILCKLLGLNDVQNIDVTEVKVWKQWERIDVFSTIKLKNSGKEENYALLIEDKAYTSMKEHQRDIYPKIAREWCDSENEWKDCKLRLCAITISDCGTDGYNVLSDFCKQSTEWEWHTFSVGELPDCSADEFTESDLFNEFWLSYWG